MRIANAAAICALTAIAAQGLTAPVSASPNSPFPPPAPEADSFIVQPLSAATPAQMVSLAPPAIDGAAQMGAPAYETHHSTETGNYQDPLKYVALPAEPDASRTLVTARPQAADVYSSSSSGESATTDSPTLTTVGPEGFIVQPQMPAAAETATPPALRAELLKPLPPQPVGMATAAGALAQPAVAAREILPPASSNLAQNPIAFGQNPVSQLPAVPPPPPSAQPTQNQPAAPKPATPSRQQIQDLRNRLRGVEDKIGDLDNTYQASPSMTVTNPAGFGADNNTGYIGASYVSRVRYTHSEPDGALVAGVGLGDARKSVGVELSYTLASVAGNHTEFGRGGFNVKVHRQLADDLSVAAGWNGLLNIGHNDFEHSLYAAATKVFPLREDIKSPFSRVAVTAGLGNGQFRSEKDIANDRGAVNLFGSVAVRAAEPVSLIAEWTGQDLTLGASIVPFKNLPLVITPALRDVAGAGDGARFVLGVGYSFKF
jgi:hypothetical protein